MCGSEVYVKPLVVFLIGMLTMPAVAQSTNPAPGRIVTTTRLVAMFSQLESELESGIQHDDSSALNRLLSEDFEVWTPAPPGQPIPREDWLQQQSTAAKIESFHVAQMAVRGLAENISIASFVLSETQQASGHPVQKLFFVVDVWKKSGQQWQLTDRYLAPVTRPKPTMSRCDKPPTGRD